MSVNQRDTPSSGYLLIVDCDEEHCSAAAANVKLGGYHMYTVVNYKRFKIVIEEKFRAIKPTLIIVDVSLPQMSGFEIVRRINQEYPSLKVPIAIMSKYKSPEDQVEAMAAGAITILEKPLTHQAITKALADEKAKQNKLSTASKVF